MSTPQGASRFGGNSNPQSSPSPGAGGSNVFTRKIGPLPLWGWMGIGLAVALVFYFWKQNKAKQTTSTGQSITPPGSSADQTTSASQIPQFVNLTNVQNAQSQTQTAQGGNQTTNVTPPAVAPPPPAPAAPPPAPGPAPQQYVTVTVGKWPSGAGGNPGASANSFGPNTAAWNSTLWGIATHYNVSGGYQKLAQINGIANPNLIYPGQQIRVPING